MPDMPKTSPASGSAPSVLEHDWFQRGNLTACRLCGIVQRADGQNKPCRGVVRVVLRADEKDAFDAAWSAVQHSENIDIKTARRKISIHDLRCLLQLVVPAIAAWNRRASDPIRADLLEALKGILADMPQPLCEHLHHAKPDQHTGDHCPVEKRLDAAIELARAAITRAEAAT